MTHVEIECPMCFLNSETVENCHYCQETTYVTKVYPLKTLIINGWVVLHRNCEKEKQDDIKSSTKTR